MTAGERLLDLYPKREDFRVEVLNGLQQPRKMLPPKLFYDEKGSRLFEEICNQPEYYPTRTELQILRDHAPEIVDALDPEAALFEFGSGSATKTRFLLNALDRAGKLPSVYLPVDISRETLINSAMRIHQDFPNVSVVPICADYTRSVMIPASLLAGASRRLAFFPGSTLGNMDPDVAVEFLRHAASTLRSGGKLLVGIDLLKDVGTLEAAYNDAAGVTAAFNLNVLERINAELGAQIDASRFQHRAFFNPDAGRIEMHLVSKMEQIVTISGRRIAFRRQETIHTENSYKYTIESFTELVKQAGYSVSRVWTDPRRLFAVALIEVKPLALEVPTDEWGTGQGRAA